MPEDTPIPVFRVPAPIASTIAPLKITVEVPAATVSVESAVVLELPIRFCVPVPLVPIEATVWFTPPRSSVPESVLIPSVTVVPVGSRSSAPATRSVPA